MRIRTKSVIIFLIFSLVPLTIIGVISYRNGEEAIKKSLGSTFQQIAHTVIDEVDRSLDEVYRNVQSITELELMQEVITDDVDNRISSFLMELSKEYGYFSCIEVLNTEGEVVASSNFRLIGRNFKQEDFFRNAIKGSPYVEDVHLDEIDDMWVVSFSFPIKAKFKEDRIVGVLSAKWKADELFRMTQLPKEEPEERYHNHLMLMRGDGLVISAPESEKEDIFKRNLIKAGLKSAILASQGKEGYLLETDEYNRQLLIGYDYSKGYRDFSGLGWFVFVVEDVQTAFAPIEQLKIITFGVGIVVALFVIISSLIVARKMTNPILKIASVAAKVARGDFEEKVNYSSADEIGSLTETFNQMIEDLRRQRARLVDKDYVDSIIANIIDTLIVVDPQGVIKTINPAILDLLGYTEEELIGQPVEKIIQPSAVSNQQSVAESRRLKTESWLKKLVERGSAHNLDLTYVTKEGQKIPVSFSGSAMYSHQPSAEGVKLKAESRKLKAEIIGIVGVARDMRETKMLIANLQKAKEKLEKSKQELEKSVENSERQRVAILNILEDVNEAREELARANKELKETQEQLIQAGKLSAIGQLAGGVAHEINNPLTGVLNNVQLIKLELESHKDFKLKDFQELLDIIEASAQRCARITRALLDFSRRSQGEFRPLNINEVIESAFVLGSHELRLEGIEMVKEFSSGLPLVLGNSTQLQQVLLNLMSNAKNALKEIKGKKKLAVRTSFLSDKELVQVEFSDNGCGIPRENLGKIFEPFFTTAEVGKGTGLGLSISYGIIQAHKGNIEVTSEEGKGTTFRITLPITKSEADISN